MAFVHFSVDRLLQEKEALLSELDACKQTLSSRTVAKELRILKKVIRSLEVRTMLSVLGIFFLQ